MTTETRTPESAELKYGLMVSLLGHVAIVTFFVVRAIVFTHDDHANLQALRVDLVALPDKNPPAVMPAPNNPEEPEAKAPAKSEPAPPPKAEKAEPSPKAKPAPVTPPKKEPEAINLDRVKSKQQQALESLKRMQALDKIKDEVSKDEQKKHIDAAVAAARAKAGSTKVKGNVLAPGSDLQGLDELQHEEYRSALDAHIKPFWQLPEWLARKKLHAQVLIRIDPKGNILSKQLVKASGNRDFDDSVLETIDRAAPMPAPPEKFVSMVAADGIFISFGDGDAAND